ncbi:hypothetical protein V5799_021877 [Amblyomma americanum]|uniref:Uncharacterized protein n=1 Tax=Amblyomma americanum TaxID=6943 RepID=A0AAQ4FM37_AMBAM
MALPYYVGPQYSFSHPRPDTCELAAAAGNESTQACGSSAGDLRHYKWFFWLSNFINGIGTSPYFTLGIAYLDENFPRALSSKYIGGNGEAGGGSGSLNPFGTVPGTMLEIEAVRNKCPNPCDLVNIFIPMLAAIVFTTFFLSTPAVAATLRCIPDQHKSVGLGIQWTIVRAFGEC